MTAFKIEDVKAFMKQLLIGCAFDSFLLSELKIQTANLYQIQGRLSKSWFDEGERELLSDREYALWNEMKPFALQLIKGNKTPSLMKIVFLLGSEETKKIIQEIGIALNLQEIEGLFLNLNYENGELHLITGTSLKIFTMEKTLEREWEQRIRHFLIQKELTFTEM